MPHKLYSVYRNGFTIFPQHIRCSWTVCNCTAPDDINLVALSVKKHSFSVYQNINCWTDAVFFIFLLLFLYPHSLLNFLLADNNDEFLISGDERRVFKLKSSKCFKFNHAAKVFILRPLILLSLIGLKKLHLREEIINKTCDASCARHLLYIHF